MEIEIEKIDPDKTYRIARKDYNLFPTLEAEEIALLENNNSNFSDNSISDDSNSFFVVPLVENINSKMETMINDDRENENHEWQPLNDNGDEEDGDFKWEQTLKNDDDYDHFNNHDSDDSDDDENENEESIFRNLNNFSGFSIDNEDERDKDEDLDLP